MTGTIKKLISDKGFGFIASDELEKEVFFHSSELQGVEYNELREGDAVTFEVQESDKGLNATQVSKA